jgi:para-aminobenzoate synthetase component 1
VQAPIYAGLIVGSVLYTYKFMVELIHLCMTIGEIKEELLIHSPEKLFETLIDATFPMASMTGAPKIRAMQLIDTFENFQRQVYSGAIGLIDENGDFILSVIIRSIFYNQRTKLLSFAVGGAITYLSEPEKEYEECLLKAGAMLKALNAIIAPK